MASPIVPQQHPFSSSSSFVACSLLPQQEINLGAHILFLHQDGSMELLDDVRTSIGTTQGVSLSPEEAYRLLVCLQAQAAVQQQQPDAPPIDASTQRDEIAARWV